MSDQAPIRAGVAGFPIQHSLSPLIHREWLKRAGVDGRYDRIEIPPGYESFQQAADDLRRKGYAGLNVTLPHKENALRYADEADSTTSRAGAANTLVFSAAGVKAYNTDVSGFALSLKAAGAVVSEQSRALVLGAGGAARGVAAALSDLGCGSIMLANRTLEKAEAIAASIPSATTLAWDRRDAALGDIDILVNATSLGMSGERPLEISLSALPKSAVVADIVYTPLKTALLADAEQHGLQTMDGLSMLMHQAAPGFEMWFGEQPVVDDALRELLVTALNHRGPA